MKIRKLISVVELIIIFCSNLVAQADYSSLKQEYSKLISKLMQKNKVAGVCIALINGDSVVWSRGFGYADIENNAKATPTTQYRIGSITKLFTGSAVMQLQELGKLNIDEPVYKYLPQFHIKTRNSKLEDITIR